MNTLTSLTGYATESELDSDDGNPGPDAEPDAEPDADELDADGAGAYFAREAPPAIRGAQLQDICIVYHPSALEDEQRFSFEDFCGQPEGEEQNHETILASFTHQDPWRPFPTRLDFDLAEVMLDSHMNTEQMERTISLFRQVLPNPENSAIFTISNGSDLSNMWNAARSSRATGVCSIFNSYLNIMSDLMFILIFSLLSTSYLYHTRIGCSSTKSGIGHSGSGVAS